MTTYSQVKEALRTGCSARRPEWDICKIVRDPQESDRDFFMTEVDFKDAVMEYCPRSCDCNVRFFTPTQQDLEATDWVIIAGS